MQISSASAADIPALCGMLGLLFTQEAEFSPDREAQARGLGLILATPELGTILVAREAGAIIGMVSLLFTVSTALGSRVALLEDMVVAPDHRGKGIGSCLLEAAIDHAHNTGCGRITLLTDRVNARAQSFYRRHGFELSPMIPLRLSLSADRHSSPLLDSRRGSVAKPRGVVSQ